MINNAGILGFPMDGELIPMADYKSCMAVNFFGAVEVTKTFLPLLRKSKGRLVNISSLGGESASSPTVTDACCKQGRHGQGWVRISQLGYPQLILTTRPFPPFKSSHAQTLIRFLIHLFITGDFRFLKYLHATMTNTGFPDWDR